MPRPHPVPDSALEQDIAVLGQKGSGKSYATKGLVERLLRKGRRTIILDPLNHWYGLKANASGGPGFPIIVIGGPNGDIDLDPKGGALLGEVLAGSDQSFIVDVSDLLRSQLITFTTDFLLSLYRHNRQALWLVAEEADVFAPQNPSMDGTRAMHDAMDQIARRGRQRGFRLWSLTQRPARLSKDVLTQASTLLVMRIRSPQDRSAAEEWIRGHAEKPQVTLVVDALASLEVGQGFVYAPDLDLLEKVRFPAITTMDTSSTPEAGAARVEIRQLAPVDVEALRRLLTPVPAEPPHDTGRSRKAPSAPAGVDLALIRSEAHVAGYTEGHAEGYRTAMAVVTERAEAFLKSLDVVQPLIKMSLTAKHPEFVERVMGGGTEGSDGQIREYPSDSPPDYLGVPPDNPSPAKPRNTDGGARRLLASAAKMHPLRLTWSQITTAAGLKARGGYFKTARKILLGNGWATEDQKGRVGLTPAGLETIGWQASGEKPIDIFAAALAPNGAAARMFAVIRANRGVSWVSIAEAEGLQPSGGYWKAGISVLRSNGLILECGDKVHVAGWLEKGQ